MSVINATPLLAAAGGDYQISRSVRVRSSATAFFSRTPSSASNRRTWTWSAWVKRGAFTTTRQVLFGGWSADTDANWIEFGFGGSSDGDPNDCFYVTTSASVVQSAALFRDPSAWYHVVVALDTTQATAINRLRLWVNGANQNLSALAALTLNFDAGVNQAALHTQGKSPRTGTARHFDGHLTEVNFIDGQALTPSSFGETDSITGVWKPKKYAGTYGTNGFYLNFSDNSSNTATTIGKDYSGNGNNWTPNNISVTAGATYDSMLDVPTMWADGGNGRGNYAVMNPLDTASGVFANANLNVSTTSGRARGTIFVASGKWYWEATITSMPSTTVFGVADTSYKIGTSNDSQSRGYVSTGSKISNGSSSAYGASFTTGDTIGVAYDVDAGTLTFYKNNTSQGTAYSDIAGYSWAPYVQGGFGADFNFGQRPFAYTPPTGFKALNTQNLPEPTIKKGNQYFDVSLWTGDQAARTITNSGSFQPDLIWTKSRSDAESHRLHDAVRGGNGSVLYELNSNLTEAEGTDTLVSGFATNGFTIASGANTPNITGRTYVGWQWKESPSAGFDIVTYTGNGVGGRTISHSLGVVPKLYILKRRDAGGYNWIVQTTVIDGSLDYLFLNTTSAKGDSGDTPPTSSVFSVSGNADVNANGGTYVAYLFAEVAGFSKFGSYTGNGSADGPFVFCGFRPRWVMIKVASGTVGDWEIHDTSRDIYNVTTNRLWANSSNAESTGLLWDIASNGFKLRDTSSNTNASGATYIFAAFAENPFKNSLAR